MPSASFVWGNCGGLVHDLDCTTAFSLQPASQQLCIVVRAAVPVKKGIHAEHMCARNCTAWLSRVWSWPKEASISEAWVWIVSPRFAAQGETQVLALPGFLRISGIAHVLEIRSHAITHKCKQDSKLLLVFHGCKPNHDCPGLAHLLDQLRHGPVGRCNALFRHNVP